MSATAVGRLGPHRSLSDELRALVAEADGRDLTLGQILAILSARGDALMMIVISFPFCQPIMIPGFSLPFGLALAVLGAHYAAGKKPWLPRRLANHVVYYTSLLALVNKLLVVTSKLEKALHPRLPRLCNDPILNRIHGGIIAICAILLALPLPIPASNLISALPILLLALGILESDGVFVIAGYVVAGVCFAAFGGLAWLGTEGFEQVARSVFG